MVFWSFINVGCLATDHGTIMTLLSRPPFMVVLSRETRFFPQLVLLDMFLMERGQETLIVVRRM